MSMNVMDPPLLPILSPVEAVKADNWQQTLSILSAHDVTVHSVLQAAGPHYMRLSEHETLRLMVVLLVQRHQAVMAEVMKAAGESEQPPIITIPTRNDSEIRRG